MKKIFLFFVMVCMTVLCSACMPEFLRTPKDVNVIVGGVDGGILNGARACEWGEQYAYYDDGMLYYYEDKASEAKTIQCGSPTQMAMTEDYIYYCHGKSLASIDLKTMEQHNVYYNEDEYIRGINVYSDEVLVAVREDEIGSGLPSNIYAVSGLEIKDAEASEDYAEFYDFVSVKNHCANWYGDRGASIFLNGKMCTSSMYHFKVRELGKNGKDVEGKVYEYGDHAVVSPEHIAEYKGKLYVLIQEGNGSYGSNNNIQYLYKNCDHLICVDPKAETYESIYQTPGPQEQIVNFSAENNEMYLLVEGILYKADLKGEQRVELANYVGSDTLTFEYANDTLFVYDGYKLLGQYK